MEDVSLNIQGEIFKVKKDTLCEHSDYFRAMFSGHYVENNQQEITIDVLEAEIFKIIVQYMQIGLINLYEYDLSTIRDIAVAANFLQITELMKQIEYTLELQITDSNWVEIMEIAESSTYHKLEHVAAVHGLLSFTNMKPEYIPSMHKLAWYLSNPYLNAENESDIFKFGFDWMINNETGADALLIILSCLDLTKLTTYDLKRILDLLGDYVNSLAIKVVQCLCVLHGYPGGISPVTLKNNRQKLTEEFTMRVWTETYKLVDECKPRKLVYTCIVPMWQLQESNHRPLPHCLYTYNDGEGLSKWMELTDSVLWGWNIITWGLTKIVMVCGEYDRGSGKFMRDVRVYDTVQNEWTSHGVELPHRRHAGLAVVGNSLFIVGGVGGHRIVLNTGIVYDLKERTYRKIAKIPDAIQSPALCSHKNKVYAALQNNIYRYDDSGETDQWVTSVATKIRLSCIRPFKDYIYGIQGYFSHLYRFQPGVDERMEIITYFSNLPMTMCNIGNRLLVFTQTIHGHSDILFVEEYTGEGTDRDSEETKEKPLVNTTLFCQGGGSEIPNEIQGETSAYNRFLKEYKGDFLADKPKVIYKQKSSQEGVEIKVIDVAGSGVIVLSTPPLLKDMSDYHRRHLSQYTYL
ncbi:kelch-like protein 26 [Aricia agestis]|uniref:kelch-like protein 26 n=1 Tax=Aricia agestis TaxID=91739 RepID=UPI001C209D94|nr:kelch-like protein 26 [Aricia agestis]